MLVSQLTSQIVSHGKLHPGDGFDNGKRDWKLRLYGGATGNRVTHPIRYASSEVYCRSVRLRRERVKPGIALLQPQQIGPQAVPPTGVNIQSRSKTSSALWKAQKPINAWIDAGSDWLAGMSLHRMVVQATQG